jgi:dihydropteroate synthase
LFRAQTTNGFNWQLIMSTSERQHLESAAPAGLVWDLPDGPLTFPARPLVMGIVNVTPDSFSDGGQFATTEQAVAHGLELVREGADLLDIGGESTRPGSVPVPVDEELRRVAPVIEQLARQTTVPLSVDTSKAAVAQACLDVGAKIINDVTALGGDPDLAKVARSRRAGVVLMHMQGTPQTMQQGPVYQDVVGYLRTFFQGRLVALTGLGLAATSLVLDPGIGFGKTLAHNLEILARLEEFQNLGRPVCLGVSRKGFLGKVLGRPVDQRLAGSLAVLCHTMSKKAVQIIRVHDVAATRDVVRMWEVLVSGGN